MLILVEKQRTSFLKPVLIVTEAGVSTTNFYPLFKLKIEDFLADTAPLLDVRSPGEFLKAHIPGAHSFPLFSDAERASVGTLYKKEGKDAAVKLGLSYVGPKLAGFVADAEKIAGAGKALRLYCWRGGMRSGSLAWLLRTAGFDCQLLDGGYKAFRRWALNQFKRQYGLILLGGLTGSGKTDLLQLLKDQGEQVIDLEEIAAHRGSSFGHLGFPSQPTAEQFENTLAWKLSQLDPRLPVWIEDESRMIGTCPIPEELWKQMNQAVLVWIHCTKEERLKRLLASYSIHKQEDMILATERLVKKLGAVRTKQVVQFIQNREMSAAISAILDYYDQAYLYSFQKRHRKSLEVDYSEENQDSLTTLKSFSGERSRLYGYEH